jgi:hypothetical protein
VSVGIVRTVDHMRHHIRVASVLTSFSLAVLACGGGEDNTAYDKALGAAYVSNLRVDAPEEATDLIDQQCAGAALRTSVGKPALVELGFNEDGTGDLSDEPKLDAAVGAKLGEAMAQCPGIHAYAAAGLIENFSVEATDETRACLTESAEKSTLTSRLIEAGATGNDEMGQSGAQVMVDALFACGQMVQAMSESIVAETGLVDPGTESYTCLTAAVASAPAFKELMTAAMAQTDVESAGSDFQNELAELAQGCAG